ncbi:MAG: ABC transporter ATP-binding protein [Proteobacteria bacterium]|nr:ABC transporter ATP-binding protein [Pseudomonadota bacterium]
MASSDFAIRAQGLSKCYTLYDHPADRLKQMLMRGRRQYYREFWALRETSFELAKGQVMGLVGRNGAGKSTLLQLVCGTLASSGGSLEVRGRVSALLELGAGFNPEFTGRENVYLSATILGLSKAEIDRRYDGIVEFSGIGDHIGQPVKTYSSGMFMRLAFSVATSVDPDILIIDEALSVGDGEFARKSFDRIIAMKESGKTILFCSHSMYHIESICDSAIWLDWGRLRMYDTPGLVTSAYQASLNGPSASPQQAPPPQSLPNQGRLTSIVLRCDGQMGQEVYAQSGISALDVEISFISDPALPTPSVAVTFDNDEWRMVCSTRSLDDGELPRDSAGCGTALVRFPSLPLLKGVYHISVYLMCERGLHIYDASPHLHTVVVKQASLEQGIFHIPCEWLTPPTPTLPDMADAQ